MTIKTSSTIGGMEMGYKMWETDVGRRMWDEVNGGKRRM